MSDVKQQQQQKEQFERKIVRASRKLRRKHKINSLATDYLSNCIQLVDVDTEHAKSAYFENLINHNQFVCFLHLNNHLVSSPPPNSPTTTPPNEFFDYYKRKQARENCNRDEFRKFLAYEFGSTDNPDSITSSKYIEQLLKSSVRSRASSCRASSRPIRTIPSINIVTTSGSAKKSSLTGRDFEFEYLKSVETTDYTTAADEMGGAPSNLTLSSTPSSTASINLSHSAGSKNWQRGGTMDQKFKQQHSMPAATTSTNHQPAVLSSSSSQQLQATQKLNSNSNLLMQQRTISESSNESSLVVLNSSARHLASSINRSLNLSLKPGGGLLSSLKRLTCEKMLLTSNNSPVGIVSRLPFHHNRTNPVGLKSSELNESFISRNRHMSSNKPHHYHHHNHHFNTTHYNNFLIDVFELLGLDLDEYISMGSYSYACLIDRNQTTGMIAGADLVGKVGEDRRSADTGESEEKYDEFDEGGLLETQIRANRKDNRLLVASTGYQPDYLDDPQLTEMTAGKNRTCLKFASYAVSIIDYVKPLELKKEINETFKEKFPYIQISLTKLRSIKRELHELARETGGLLDLSVVAQSYIYFEKLILQGLINKTNRKHLAANCLILAAKLNDTPKKDISRLIDATIAKFRFDSRRDMIAYEFPILVALEFNLTVRYENDFFTHYQKLLASSSIGGAVTATTPSSSTTNNKDSNNNNDGMVSSGQVVAAGSMTSKSIRARTFSD